MDALEPARRLVLPPPGDVEGIEGYRVVAADGAVLGEALAINRTGSGLTLLLQPADEPAAVLPVAVALVAELDDAHETIRLHAGAAETLAAAPRLPRAQLVVGGPGLLRAIPTELLNLVPETPGSVETSSSSWVLALVLGVVASVSLFVAHFVIAGDGGATWALMALPALLFVASGAVFLHGVDAPLADKLRLVPASLLGYTPRERKRR